jgi:hypothetical protein
MDKEQMESIPIDLIPYEEASFPIDEDAVSARGQGRLRDS